MYVPAWGTAAKREDDCGSWVPLHEIRVDLHLCTDRPPDSTRTCKTNAALASPSAAQTFCQSFCIAILDLHTQHLGFAGRILSFNVI